MMDFHYNVIDEQYKGQYELIYGDTDSFTYLFKCSDVLMILLVQIKNILVYQTCNGKMQDAINKKVVGKFKDEMNGKY
jgi:hypothetical protein